MFRKILALLKKDLLNETSYKLAFILNFAGVLFSILTYFFIAKLFGSRFSVHLEQFGTAYFPYVLLNMALFSYIGVGVGSFAARLRLEQMQGTLESLVLSPTSFTVILLSMFIWNLLFASFDLGIYTVLAVFLFKIDFSQINLISSIVIFLLTILSFSSLGIISAAFVLIYKRGNPVSSVLTGLEGLFGGIYFPVTVMPAALQMLSACLPITYAVRALQLAVYKGYSLDMLGSELLPLLFFTIILGPISIIFLKHSIKKARIKGNLAHY